MTVEPQRAVPAVNDLTRPFWEGAKQGRLVVQRCRQCSYYNHPPRALCDQCLSEDLDFQEVSGHATIWSFSVMHQKVVAGFEQSTPYLTALVELDEQPMLLMFTNLPGVSKEDVRIGARVRVTFQRLNDELVLPQYLPVAGLSRVMSVQAGVPGARPVDGKGEQTMVPARRERSQDPPADLSSVSHA